jgi:nuclear pore complex protein Nup85
MAEGALTSQRSQLAHDLAAAFHSLQEAYDDDEADLLESVIICCKRYESLTSKAIEDGIIVAETEGLEEQDEEHMQMLYELRSTLQLAEAIYFPISDDLPRCDALMEWLNTLDPQPSQRDGEEIMMSRVPCQHSAFWDYVSKGVLRGLFAMAAECLAGSGLQQQDPATARATLELQSLLQSCPRISMHEDHPHDYKMRYRQWRGKVLLAAKQTNLPDPEMASAFRQVYELLKGDKDAIFRQSDTWQESLAALALLFDPTGCKSAKDVGALFELVENSEDSAAGIDLTIPSDVAAAALCAGKIPQAITKLRLANLTAAALLGDLLDKVEVLDDVADEEIGLTIRDILILELGDAMLSQLNAWQASVYLWQTCGDAGLDRVEEILPRIPLDTQTKADTVLGFCTDLQLHEQARSIETGWAKVLEKDGQLGEALNAYDRAQSYAHIDRLIWSLFDEALMSGQPNSRDPYLTEAIQTPQATSSREISALIAPYATLVGVYEHRNSGNSEQYGVHLTALLKFPDLPRKYLPVLLAEMLPLLEERSPVLSSRDIFDALAALEEFYEQDQSDGIQLLQKALEADSLGFDSWRSSVPPNFTADDLLDMIRLKLAKFIGTSL